MVIEIFIVTNAVTEHSVFSGFKDPKQIKEHGVKFCQPWEHTSVCRKQILELAIQRTYIIDILPADHDLHQVNAVLQLFIGNILSERNEIHIEQRPSVCFFLREIGKGYHLVIFFEIADVFGKAEKITAFLTVKAIDPIVIGPA